VTGAESFAGTGPYRAVSCCPSQLLVQEQQTAIMRIAGGPNCLPVMLNP
jgi:hypothetical protein